MLVVSEASGLIGYDFVCLLKDTNTAHLASLRRQQLTYWHKFQPNLHYIFIDDDPYLQGKYFTPFGAPVECPSKLRDHKRSVVLIGSRTFASELAARIPNTDGTISTIDDLLRMSTRVEK